MWREAHGYSAMVSSKYGAACYLSYICVVSFFWLDILASSSHEDELRGFGSTRCMWWNQTLIDDGDLGSTTWLCPTVAATRITWLKRSKLYFHRGTTLTRQALGKGAL